jgi:hypothetical protein
MTTSYVPEQVIVAIETTRSVFAAKVMAVVPSGAQAMGCTVPVPLSRSKKAVVTGHVIARVRPKLHGCVVALMMCKVAAGERYVVTSSMVAGKCGGA